MNNEGPSTGERQVNATCLQDRIRELRNKENLVDVLFRVVFPHAGSSHPEKTFHAHKLILAAASPVFAENFYPGGVEEDASHAEYRVTDISPEAFESMLRFAYGENVEFPTVQAALQTYKAAKKYKIEPLRIICIDQIQRFDLSPEDAIDTLDDDVHTEIVGLQERCLFVAEAESLKVIKLAAEKASKETIELVLQSDRLSVPLETRLLEKLVEGIEARAQSQLIENSNRAKDAFLRPFLKYIRFLTMSAEQFVSALELCGNVLSPEEGFGILKTLCKTKEACYPRWCCQVSTPRCPQPNQTAGVARELQIMPRHSLYGDYMISEVDSSLMSLLEIKVHSGKFGFTSVSLAYRVVVPELQIVGKEQEGVQPTRCILSIRNYQGGFAYDRVANVKFDGGPVELTLPFQLDVSANEEAIISVLLVNPVGADFSGFQKRKHRVEGPNGVFEVKLSNCRSWDTVFAVSTLKYVEIPHQELR